MSGVTGAGSQGGAMSSYTGIVATPAPGIGGGKEVLVVVLGAVALFLIYLECRRCVRRLRENWGKTKPRIEHNDRRKRYARNHGR